MTPRPCRTRGFHLINIDRMIGGTRFVAAPRNATLDQIANEDFSRRRLRRNFRYHKVFLINSISRKYVVPEEMLQSILGVMPPRKPLPPADSCCKDRVRPQALD